jgi:hypothetical protein
MNIKLDIKRDIRLKTIWKETDPKTEVLVVLEYAKNSETEMPFCYNTLNRRSLLNLTSNVHIRLKTIWKETDPKTEVLVVLEYASGQI